MTELNLKSGAQQTLTGGDKQIPVPALALAESAQRRGQLRVRRRPAAPRLALSSDDGFRPFRVY